MSKDITEARKKKEEQIIEKHIEQLLFDVKRGFLQFIVLSLISQGPTYAYEIKTEIYRITGGTFDIDRNNLYKKLRTLEKDGILISQLEPSDRGAQRKYYTITPLGKTLLNRIYDLLLPLMRSVRQNITSRMK